MATWRRGGRPRKAAEERRTERVALYLTPAERAELERRTALTGWRDVGAYVRRAIMAQRSPRATVPQLNVQAWGELARTAANLNQVTRHLNEGGQLDAATAAGLAVVVERLGGEVRALRLGLLGIKGAEESSAGSSSAGCASASEQNP
jgi:transposase